MGRVRGGAHRQPGGSGQGPRRGRSAWTPAVDASLLLAGPVFPLRLRLLPQGSPVGWVGVSVTFPGWPSQVVGGGGSYGQLAESRPRACQDAYSNSGPQGPAGRWARAWRGGGSRGLAWGRRGWKQQKGAVDGGLAGQLLTWETCPTSPGRQVLNTLPRAPTASPMATGNVPGAAALCAPAGLGQCPLPSMGAAPSPRSQGVSLSLGQALAGRLTAHTGRLPTATTASWLTSSGCTVAPSLPGPTSHWEQGL